MSGKRSRRGLAVCASLLMFAVSTAAGDEFFVPYIAPAPWKTVLVATNPTSEQQTIFATYFVPQVVPAMEVAHDVPPGSSVRLDLGAQVPGARSARVEMDGAPELALKMEFELGGAAVVGSPLPGVSSQSLSIGAPAPGTAAWTGVAIANLGDVPDSVRVSAYDASGILLSTTVRSVPLYGVDAGLLAEWFPAGDGVAYLRVEGGNRLQGLTISQTHAGALLTYPADAGTPTRLDPDPSMTYFIVGYPAFGQRPAETYVIGLSDPVDIAEARGILADPSRSRIVVGAIARGHGGHNRNMTAPGAPAYSWHVDRFEGFADLAAEVCDGRPSDVELDRNYWVDTVGRICFWTPTIVRELSVDEVATGVFGAVASP